MKKMIFLALALCMALAALPAFAQDKADWAFYGQARMWTAWEDASEETFPLGSASARSAGWNPGFGTANQDDNGLDWHLQTNARFGANVKWGNVGGRVEFGNTNAPVGGDYAATFRLLYGTWNFGGGTLLFGKDYTPYFFLNSGLCGPGGGECNGIGWGSIYGGRRSQIKLVMGGLQVALVEPVSTVFPRGNLAAVAANRPGIPAFNIPAVALAPNDVDQTIPRIEASYNFNLGPVGLFIGGLYNTASFEYGTAQGVREVDVDSYALGIGFNAAFGPFYINGQGQWAQNLGHAGVPLAGVLYPQFMLVNPNNWGEEDADYLTAQLTLGFKVTPSFSLEGGVVYQKASCDYPSGLVANFTDWEQDTWVYYIQAVWSPAKNFIIVPEFGIIDQGDLEMSNSVNFSDFDMGKVWWFGIKWQINF